MEYLSQKQALYIKALAPLILVLALASGPHGVAQAQHATTAPAELIEPESAPVTIDGRVLFHVRGFESYPADRRAREIEKRIIRAAKDPNILAGAVQAKEVENGIDIMAGDQRLVSIFESDAKLESVTRHELSRAAVLRINEAIQNFRDDREPGVVWRGAAVALAATAVVVLVFFLLRIIFRRVQRRLETRFRRRIQSFKVGSLELVQAERIWGIVIGGVRTLKVLCLLVLFYFFFEFALGQFPWTRSISITLGDMIFNPLRMMGAAFVDYLPNFIFLLVLGFVAYYGLKLIRLLFTAMDQGTLSVSGFEREWAKPTFNIVRILVIAFILIVAYPYIPGSESEAFKGITIFLGVIFSLGSSSAVSNIIAGYTMIYRRAFKIGDRIQIGEFRGDVTALRLLTTHLKTIKNEVLVVPNSLILSSNLINFSTLAQEQGLILHTTVGIGYETPWRQVEAMLLTAADRTPELLKSPAPFVLLKSLNQFSVDYEINAYCSHAHGMAHIYAELHRNILDQFNEYGVQIMTPSYEGDPEEPKVVPPAQWHAAPAKPAPNSK